MHDTWLFVDTCATVSAVWHDDVLGVDVEFERLLIAIFGGEFIETFKVKRPAGWVDLMAAFESRKRTASPFKSSPLNVSLPFSFIDYHKKCRVHESYFLAIYKSTV